VYLPKGITIQWQLKVTGEKCGYFSHKVDCSPLVVQQSDWCAMLISIPSGTKVDINADNPNREYVNGDHAYLPMGITIRWRIYENGVWSGWHSKYVDCTALVYPGPT
jgi:Mor family transcriptional regulator